MVLVLFALLHTVHLASAETASVTPATTLRIVVGQGQLSLRGQENLQAVQYQCADLEAERTEKETVLHASTVKGECVVHIPARTSVHAFVSDGGIQSQGLKQQHLRLQKGSIRVNGGEGSLQAHVVKGDLWIQNFTGEIKTETGVANTHISKSSGRIVAQAFQGISDLNNLQGNLNAVQQNGQLKLASFQGEGNAEGNKASVNMTQIKGRFEASTSEGPLQVHMNQVADLVLKSGTGKIQVNVSGPASPLVWAWSGLGELSAPSSLKSTRDAFGKLARGRFPASEPRGSLTIRSQEGPVTVQ